MAVSTLIRRPRVLRVLFETAVAVAALYFDPLGIAVQKMHAFDNDVAVLTQRLAPTPANGQLAVVLIDEDTLRQWNIDWPVGYRKTAEIIHTLACARAKGAFFDFTASLGRNLADGEDELRRSVENSANVGPDCPDGRRPDRIRVFFAKIDGVDTPLARDLERLDAAFPLSAGAADDVYPAGADLFPDHALALRDSAPAFGAMRAVFGDASDTGALCVEDDARPKCWTKPLKLVWSAEIDRMQPKVTEVACRGPLGWWRTALNVLGVIDAEHYEPCPPVLTLSGVDLFRDRGFIEAHGGDPIDALAGRFVFVGTRLAGLNDQIASPIHGYVPGVYKHAVALDNLLHFRSNYPTIPETWALYSVVVPLFLAIEAAREFSRDRKSGGRFVGWLAAVALLAAFAVIVLRARWPASLIFAVCSYYIGTLLFFGVAERAYATAATRGASTP